MEVSLSPRISIGAAGRRSAHQRAAQVDRRDGGRWRSGADARGGEAGGGQQQGRAGVGRDAGDRAQVFQLMALGRGSVDHGASPG